MSDAAPDPTDPPASGPTSDAEIQRLLRQEVQDLRTALDDRFREMAVLTRMIEEAEHRHVEELARQAALAELRVTLASVAARRAAGASDLPKAKAQISALKGHPLMDVDWYREANADVAGAGIDPVRHYVEAGAYEGRDPGPNFSTMGYYAANPDVASAGWAALAHYASHGEAEGRGGAR